MKQLTVIGGGWAGLTAAVRATQLGYQVRLLEAAPQLGGRARRITHDNLELDNGQHVLIGAYTSTLSLLKTLGVDIDQTLHRQALDLRFGDGCGLQLPAWPAPLNVLMGVLMTKGWSLHDKWSFLKRTTRWQRSGFMCEQQLSVAQLCQGMPEPVMQQLIEPLCVSALNLDSTRASGQVFLKVLHDALLSGPSSSDMLLPRTNLSQLLPDAAQRWLQAHGAQVELGHRVSKLTQQDGPVILACPSWQAAELVQHTAPAWSAQTGALHHTAIATVYLRTSEPLNWASPMRALRHGPDAPAQFAFDKGRLTGESQFRGVLALVVSDSSTDRQAVTEAVLQQVRHQCGLQALTWLTTVMEKRATFACTPNLQRPSMLVTDGVWACGDYVAGPYPATLEGAVRSGIAAADAVHAST